jgi:hypothetical protein
MGVVMVAAGVKMGPSCVGRMKARPFLTVVLASVLLLLALAAGSWWLVLARSPLQLQHQALTMPVAARFVPRQAPLSLYLLSDGRQLEAYARAVAPSRRRHQAAGAIAQLRDGAFAAAGLDYRSELATWLGPETGLALLADQPGAVPSGWLLSLRSRDSDGARRFLQRFWQTRSLAGTDLQVSSYRGMGLISGRGALAGQPALPLATALINDDLVLIASGRGVLEQALDVSQIDELNQAADPALQASLGQLGPGAALLTARPGALQQWLAAPAGLSQLVAALRPEGPGLALEARFELAEPLPPLPLAADAGAALLQAFRGEASGLALLQAPAAWPEALQALLQQAMDRIDPPLPALVAAADRGPLLWAQGPQGWRLGTPAGSPDPEVLQQAVQAEGLVQAPLTLNGQTVEVWTRLAAPAPALLRRSQGNPAGQLEATLVGARAAAGPRAPSWWAQSLAALAQQQETRTVPQQRLAQLQALQAPDALLRWALAAAPARQLLQQWLPWQWLSGLAGQPLAGAVDGLALAVEPEGGGLLLHARLGFA